MTFYESFRTVITIGLNVSRTYDTYDWFVMCEFDTFNVKNKYKLRFLNVNLLFP